MAFLLNGESVKQSLVKGGFTVNANLSSFNGDFEMNGAKAKASPCGLGMMGVPGPGAPVDPGGP